MKRTGLLLTGMVIITGCLTYACRILPHQESESYQQENVGAQQEQQQEPAEQVHRQPRMKRR